MSRAGFLDPLRAISGAPAEPRREHNILRARAAEALRGPRLDLGSPFARLREGAQKAQSLA